MTRCYETPIISVSGNIVEQMPARDTGFIAHSPQCFRLDDILNVHLKERKTNKDYIGIVDSCGLMFKHNIQCNMIIGNRGNIKVTTISDYCTLLGTYTAEDYKQLLFLTESNK